MNRKKQGTNTRKYLLELAAFAASLLLCRVRVGESCAPFGLACMAAAELSGILVNKMKYLIYALSGFFAGLAGLSYAAIFSSSVAPGTGAGLELDAIGGAIIGGTSMTGGLGSVTGTLLGVFVMSLLKTGLPYIGLQANWQQIITGLVLIVAIYIDVLKNRKAL